MGIYEPTQRYETQVDFPLTVGEGQVRNLQVVQQWQRKQSRTNPEEEAGKPEDTVYANRISGMLWLDVLEDKDSGAYPGDGIWQEGEQPLQSMKSACTK
ncbi:MAG TPA: hypothetical protein DEP27_00530, partial [Ruminococcaceae bacterium]|nr:hypothetical protein [Oscillospiraceae bacterium]